jgi:hypothetical protein
VHPAPSDAKTSLPNLSQDLLDAIGAVGRREPRLAGDRHLLRALVHFIHGPVRHVIVDDAQLFTVDALDALHEAALVGRVQLWLTFDAAQRPPRGPTVNPDPRIWMTDVCTTITPSKLVRVWQQREPHETCQLPAPGWWHSVPTASPAAGYAGPCTNPGAHPGASHQVECLLGLARRAMTAGHNTATHVRRRIEELLTHPATTAAHYWALTAADREPWTAGMDALGQTHPDAQRAPRRRHARRRAGQRGSEPQRRPDLGGRAPAAPAGSRSPPRQPATRRMWRRRCTRRSLRRGPRSPRPPSTAVAEPAVSRPDHTPCRVVVRLVAFRELEARRARERGPGQTQDAPAGSQTLPSTSPASAGSAKSKMSSSTSPKLSGRCSSFCRRRQIAHRACAISAKPSRTSRAGRRSAPRCPATSPIASDNCEPSEA